MKEITKQKISIKLKGNKNRLNKSHDFMTKIKIRNSNRGYHWFNNGLVEVKAKECPENFSKGRLDKNKPVRKPSKIQVTKKWYHDSYKNYLLSEEPTQMLLNKRLYIGMIKKKDKIENIKGDSITFKEYFSTTSSEDNPKNSSEGFTLKPLKKSLTELALETLKRETPNYSITGYY